MMEDRQTAVFSLQEALASKLALSDTLKHFSTEQLGELGGLETKNRAVLIHLGQIHSVREAQMEGRTG